MSNIDLSKGRHERNVWEINFMGKPGIKWEEMSSHSQRDNKFGSDQDPSDSRQILVGKVKKLPFPQHVKNFLV
jgi:hypothetical protein